MGIFDRIKGFFNTGGIKVKLDAPGTFVWEQRHINVVVRLTGNKERPTTINELDFTLKPHSPPGPSTSGSSGDHSSSFSYRWGHPVSIELAPGELRDVTVKVLLPKPMGQVDWADMPHVTSMQWDAMRKERDCELIVAVKVEGARFSRSAARRLRVPGALMGGINQLRNLRSEIDDLEAEVAAHGEEEPDAAAPR